MTRIADRVKLVSENLANTLGTSEGQAQMQATLKNLAEVTESLLVFPIQTEINTLHVGVLNPTDTMTISALEALKNMQAINCKVLRDSTWA